MKDNQFRDKYKTYVNSILQKTVKDREEPACVTDIDALPVGENNASIQKANLNPSANLVVYKYQPRIFERILDFLLHPAICFLLILILGMGLLLELNKPGTGFPLFASIGAAFLLFTPLHLDGFASYSEISLFCLGLGLAVIQFIWFRKSGFLLTIGLLLAAAGLTLSLCPTLDISFSNLNAWMPLLKAAGLVLSASALIYLAHRLASRHNNLRPIGSVSKQRAFFTDIHHA
jgi:membrane-bound serine protease (ClpP class)